MNFFFCHVFTKQLKNAYSRSLINANFEAQLALYHGDMQLRILKRPKIHTIISTRQRPKSPLFSREVCPKVSKFPNNNHFSMNTHTHTRWITLRHTPDEHTLRWTITWTLTKYYILSHAGWSSRQKILRIYLKYYHIAITVEAPKNSLSSTVEYSILNSLIWHEQLEL